MFPNKHKDFGVYIPECWRTRVKTPLCLRPVTLSLMYFRVVVRLKFGNPWEEMGAGVGMLASHWHTEHYFW